MNTKKTAWLCLAVLVGSCLIYACSDPMGGDEKGKDASFSITINGGGGGSRTATTLSWDGETKIDELLHTITLTNDSGQVIPREGVSVGKTEYFIVAPGHWVITIQAFKGSALKAEGSNDADLKPGRNPAITVTMREPPFYVADSGQWEAACVAIKSRSGGTAEEYKNYTIKIIDNFPTTVIAYESTFGGTQYINVTITGNKTIRLEEQGSLLRIGSNQNVVIHDTNFEGNSVNNTALIYVDGSNARLTMEGKSSVFNNTRSTNGGGGVGGGGVYFTGSNSTFTMKDSASVHHNNTTDGWGGGVYFSGSGSTMTMKDNASVRHNNSTGGGGDGGGVYIINGTFNMKDTATISDNTTNCAGGGVYAAISATFNMISGTISGNKTIGSTGSGGGGVCVANGGTFNMTGGTISYNTAVDSGGGVWVYNASFRMETGTIYGANESVSLKNITQHFGAALHIINNGTAERGTFHTPGDPTSEWTKNYNLTNSDDTIRVRNGVVQ